MAQYRKGEAQHIFLEGALLLFPVDASKPVNLVMTPLGTAVLHFELQELDIQEVDSVADSEYHVGILTEGLRPRAIVFAVAETGGTPRHEAFTQVSEYLLRKVGSPLRWAADLSLFLKEVTALRSRENRGLIIHLTDTRIAIQSKIRAGNYAGPVWDLMTGRRTAFDALLPAAAVCASAAANTGDIILDTKFISKTYFLRTPNDDPIIDLADEILALSECRIPVLAIETEFDHCAIVREFTVRSWLVFRRSVQDQKALVNELASELQEAFYSDDPEHGARMWSALLHRCSDLVGEHRLEVEWRERTQRIKG